MQDRFLVSAVLWGSACGGLFGLLLDGSAVGVMVCFAVGAVGSCAWAWKRNLERP